MDYQSVSLNERVENIKDNSEEVNRLIEEYKPFIASVVQSASGKFVRYGEDDELSIGLIAFEEAIKVFDKTKGNFLAFARNVIKRRLIDFYRKESKYQGILPIEQGVDSNEEGEEIDFASREAVKQYSETETAEFRKLEIEELKKELNKWGMTFFEIAQSSPKHEETRKICMNIVDIILKSPELIDIMKNKKYLPIAEIEKKLKLPRKRIERVRNYIVAVVLIMTGDYEYIKSFVKWR